MHGIAPASLQNSRSINLVTAWGDQDGAVIFGGDRLQRLNYGVGGFVLIASFGLDDFGALSNFQH